MAKIIIEINDELKHEFRQVCAEKAMTQKKIITELILNFVAKNFIKKGKR